MCDKLLHYFEVTGQFTVQYNSHFSAKQLYLHLHCTSPRKTTVHIAVQYISQCSKVGELVCTCTYDVQGTTLQFTMNFSIVLLKLLKFIKVIKVVLAPVLH